MRVARSKYRKGKDKLTKVRSVMQATSNSNDSEVVMAPMTKSARGKSGVAQVGSQSIRNNFGTSTS